MIEWYGSNNGLITVNQFGFINQNRGVFLSGFTRLVKDESQPAFHYGITGKFPIQSPEQSCFFGIVGFGLCG